MAIYDEMAETKKEILEELSKKFKDFLGKYNGLIN